MGVPTDGLTLRPNTCLTLLLTLFLKYCCVIFIYSFRRIHGPPEDASLSHSDELEGGSLNYWEVF